MKIPRYISMVDSVVIPSKTWPRESSVVLAMTPQPTYLLPGLSEDGRRAMVEMVDGESEADGPALEFCVTADDGPEATSSEVPKLAAMIGHGVGTVGGVQTTETLERWPLIPRLRAPMKKGDVKLLSSCDVFATAARRVSLPIPTTANTIQMADEKPRLDELDLDLARKLKSFIDTTSLRRLDDLKRLLLNWPSRGTSPSILPPESEMDKRLQLVSQLENHWERGFTKLTSKKSNTEWKPFTNRQITTLIAMNVANPLRFQPKTADSTASLPESLRKTPTLVKSYEFPSDLWGLAQ
ncbi:hypothetical protein B0T25DRAFT_513700 [Lasiosphaeria hispida]|uniref:Uncharacterized protein n=1 Tax=Lasiosphaeria hispida TaxID=260671 RepID=A0AAJ0HVN8_9PEZI|nr:hypothetical protein B0T25DRAFT_513700 [Lasiosphaeria hispida]